ncbi:MAG: hypothetical protein AB1758_25360, partial [Candidatus Eremiobacterota bacterium]
AAVNLAREFMAVERAKAYDQVASSGPLGVPLTATMNGVQTTETYQVTVSVNELEAGRLKAVLVTVGWGSTGSKVQLETLVTNL